LSSRGPNVEAWSEKYKNDGRVVVGYQRQQNFQPPEKSSVNNWGLSGNWTVGGEYATLVSAPGKIVIVFRFHARDLHLVFGPSKDGKPVRFKVPIHGLPPGDDRGIDVNAQGEGTVNEYRLYQLVRQEGKIEDRTFQIEFLDSGVRRLP
jgi:hypothetical protein